MEDSSKIIITTGICPPNNRVNYRKGTLVCMSLNNLAPKYMSDKFKYASHRENTRQCSSGKHKFINSFRYSAVKIWNNLKINIRYSCNQCSFKTNYLKDYVKGA